MQNVLCTEGAGASPTGTRAACLAAQPPQTSGRRWQAFALLVAAYGYEGFPRGLAPR